ncbi:hypothetical protein HDC33_002766 [Sporosarcina sp. JAI121]|nr:hypothetical protein [Sporosarcina sp. JAI121]
MLLRMRYDRLRKKKPNKIGHAIIMIAWPIFIYCFVLLSRLQMPIRLMTVRIKRRPTL